MIVVIFGPPGAGKTTITTRLAERLTTDAAADNEFRVLHSDDFSRNTYARMYERVAAHPDDDWLVDGTFYKREWRERFRRFAGRTTVKFVYVTASLETCLERNRERDGIEEDAVHIIHREFDPPRPDLTVNTDVLDPEEAVDRVYEHVGQWQTEEAGSENELG